MKTKSKTKYMKQIKQKKKNNSSLTPESSWFSNKKKLPPSLHFTIIRTNTTNNQPINPTSSSPSPSPTNQRRVIVHHAVVTRKVLTLRQHRQRQLQPQPLYRNWMQMPQWIMKVEAAAIAAPTMVAIKSQNVYPHLLPSLNVWMKKIPQINGRTTNRMSTMKVKV